MGEFISGLALAQYAGMMGPAAGRREIQGSTRANRRSCSALVLCAGIAARVSSGGYDVKIEL
ncbi:hypothetical protein CFAM422_012115 [Trichoderma lentiforme]|uniref:Uncharacterized protein n=1 Tax=Trichoderma lentiforme TaxID=1567552 RepID=A0A9P4X4K7_9HYPO|nr:hypothetical protein CFAM422_012115 [Trichoderma lentiforme]